MNKPYYIPEQTLETEYEIKKSRFIARLAPAQNREQAMQVLEQARLDYPDARHHCWAYLLGSPYAPVSMAMSDDGEPSGTAGKPILNVMQHKDVGEVMLVVIRYFGGIKLGAGGLVRAYSQAAQQAYDEAQLREKIFLEQQKIICDFNEEQSIRHWLNNNGGHVADVSYHQVVELVSELPEERIACLKTMLDGLKYAHLDKRQSSI